MMRGLSNFALFKQLTLLIFISFRDPVVLSFTPLANRGRRGFSSLITNTKARQLPLRTGSEKLKTAIASTNKQGNDASNSDINQLLKDYPNDYLITDSKFLGPSERPSIVQALSTPRDMLSLLISSVGVVISYYNIEGVYDSTYIQVESVAIGLGFLSFVAYVLQLQTGYLISNNVRRGIVDDASVNLFSAFYTAAVSWLALRTSEQCPEWLIQGDGVLPWFCVGVFAFSLLAPLVTLLAARDASGGPVEWITVLARGKGGSKNEKDEIPALSEVELLRARGMLAIGCVACVFAPDAVAFALGGQEWWDRVNSLYPSQRLQESSTSLFALFANEASMLSHRAGKAGVTTYQNIVPTFAVVCFILAIIPCVCSLYWLGEGVSFFSFYRE